MTVGIPPWLEALGVGTDPAVDDAQERAKESAQIQQGAAEEANKLYIDYMNRALAAQDLNLRRALAAQQANLRAGLTAQFGLADASDLTYRQFLNAAQAQQSPYQLARISALQSLPVLQRLSGTKAYRIPAEMTEMDYTTGRPDFSSVLRKAISQVDAEDAEIVSPSATTPTPPSAPPSTTGLTPEQAGGLYDLFSGSGGGGTVPAQPGGWIVPSQTSPWQGLNNYSRGVQSGGTFVGPDGQLYQKVEYPDVGGYRPPIAFRAVGTNGAQQPTISREDFVNRFSGNRVLQQPAGSPEPVPGSNPDNPTGVSTPPSVTPSISIETGVGTAGTGPMTQTTTALQEFIPEFDFRESPLYQYRKRQADIDLRRQLRARGLDDSETGALIGAKEQERIAAEEAENQYNRILNLVNLGLGGQVSAGAMPAQAAGPVAGLYTNLGGDISGTLNSAANARSGIYGQFNPSSLYQQFGTGLAENRAQIGQAQAAQNAYSYTPVRPGNIFDTIGKLGMLYSGFGGGGPWGGGEFGYFGAPGSSTNPW